MEYLIGYRRQWIQQIREVAAQRLGLWRIGRSGRMVCQEPRPEEHHAVARRLAAALDADEKLWKAARRIAEKEVRRNLIGEAVALSRIDARAEAVKRNPKIWGRYVRAQFARVESFECKDWLAIETFEIASYAHAAVDVWHVLMTDEWLKDRVSALLGNAGAERRLKGHAASSMQSLSAQSRARNTKSRDEKALRHYLDRVVGGDDYDAAIAKAAKKRKVSVGTLERRLGGKTNLQSLGHAEIVRLNPQAALAQA